ncbi:MAG: hypothetical protein WAL51_15600 [Candidatus Acidiferrales bacterium]
MSERPSLGLSTIASSEFPVSPWDKWRRIGFVLVTVIVIGIVFYCLTQAVQTSTARATNSSGLHYDPNAP